MNLIQPGPPVPVIGAYIIWRHLEVCYYPGLNPAAALDQWAADTGAQISDKGEAVACAGARFTYGDGTQAAYGAVTVWRT